MAGERIRTFKLSCMSDVNAWVGTLMLKAIDS